jgi:hypothetical protein
MKTAEIKVLKTISTKWLKEIGNRNMWVRIYPNPSSTDDVDYHIGQPVGDSTYIPSYVAAQGKRACIKFLKLTN